MNWEKIKKSYYYKEPVEHILAPSIFDLKEYETLYENQNNLSHQVWQEFDAKYKIGYEFLQDIQEKIGQVWSYGIVNILKIKY